MAGRRDAVVTEALALPSWLHIDRLKNVCCPARPSLRSLCRLPVAPTPAVSASGGRKEGTGMTAIGALETSGLPRQPLSADRHCIEQTALAGRLGPVAQIPAGDLHI